MANSGLRLSFYSAIRRFAIRPLSMLILAIDTALDACAAGVLDTDAGKLIAQESQAMKRGHAEALMPLIARVMKAVRHRFRGARPHRGDHRPRQLHRTCGSAFPPRAALRWPPASRSSG